MSTYPASCAVERKLWRKHQTGCCFQMLTWKYKGTETIKRKEEKEEKKEHEALLSEASISQVIRVVMEVPLPVVHSPQSRSSLALSHLEWLLSRLLQSANTEPQLYSFLFLFCFAKTSSPPPLQAHGCHSQWKPRSLKPPKPWLNLHFRNARVWVCIYLALGW